MLRTWPVVSILRERVIARNLPFLTPDYWNLPGGQRLMLEYHGVNHEQGNLFIYAPRQKVLMLVDVIYPGFVPYKNLGIAEDVQGYTSRRTGRPSPSTSTFSSPDT